METACEYDGQIENIRAEHCENVIYSIVLRAKVKSEPTKIQIQDAQEMCTSDAAFQ